MHRSRRFGIFSAFSGKLLPRNAIRKQKIGYIGFIKFFSDFSKNCLLKLQ